MIRNPSAIQPSRSSYYLAAVFTGYLLLVVSLAISNAQVRSAITPDGTLGTIVTPDGRVFDITGGTRPDQGPNLFHSFGQFDVGTGDTAHFVAQPGVDNIIGRVTGGSASLIDGRLRSDASLFLLNPSGLMFGPHATLDVNGSFHASTADALRFADGAAFSARLNEKSTLTVASPAAFGFLSEKPAGIAIEGSRLEVLESETLSLVGGDVKIVGRRSTVNDPPTLSAPSGRINLVSVASPGNVTMNSPEHMPAVTVDHAERLGVIEVSQAALLSVSGAGGGIVTIRGGHFLVENANIFADTEGGSRGAPVGINVEITEKMILREGALLTTDVLGAGTAGNIEVTAPRLEVTTGAVLGSRAWAGSTGNAGNITITAEQLTVAEGGQLSADARSDSRGRAGTVTVTVSGLVELLNGGQLSASTFARGDAGSVAVQAGELRIDDVGNPSQLTGIVSNANRGSSGHAGTVTVTVSGLVELLNGAEISSSTFAQGDAGDVKVQAGELRIDNVGTPDQVTGIFSQANPDSSGHAGTVTVTVEGLMELLNGGQITSSTFAQGDAGSVVVQAGELRIDGTGTPDQLTGIVSNANPDSSGNAGTVTVTVAGLVELLNGGQITSDTFAQGNAGSVEVQAGELRIDDVGNPEQFTGISSDTVNASGDAGTVTVTVSALIEVLNGGQITSSTFAQGDAGSVEVQAGELRIDDVGNPDQVTGIVSNANRDSSGDAGTVTVTVAGLMELLNGAEISSSTFAQGDAGDVKVQAGELRIDDVGNPDQVTGIFSNANRDSSGDAGTVTVTVAGLMELLNGAEISSSTFAQGDAGDVKVQAGELRIDDVGTPDQLTGIVSNAERGSSGDAGTVRVTVSGLVELLSGAEISSHTFARGDAGSVAVQAGELRIDGTGNPSGELTGIASQANRGSSGHAGTVTVTVSGLVELLNGAEISSSTFAQGDAGDVKVQAGELRIDDVGTPDQLTGIVSNAERGSSGDAGTVRVTVSGLVELLSGAEISSHTFARGDAGSVAVQAGELRIDGTGNPSGELTGIASQANRGSSGHAGTVTVTVSGLMELLNGGVISSSTFAQGDAGDVKVQADELRIDDVGNPDQFTGITSQANPDSSGDAGTVTVTVSALIELLNGGQISSSTFAQGDAGSVAVQAGELRIDNVGNPDQLTGIIGLATREATGMVGNIEVEAGTVTLLNGGTISIEARQSLPESQLTQPTESRILISADHLHLNGQASITAESTGNSPASVVEIHAGALLMEGESRIATTSNKASGGNIQVIAQSMVWLQDSAVTATVRGGPGTHGGNITIGSELIILENSQIVSDAFQGRGGDIAIEAVVLLADPTSSVSAKAQDSEVGIDGQIDIRALVTNLSGLVTPLPPGFAPAAELLRNRCAAQLHAGTVSSLVDRGRAGVPATPEDILPSRLYQPSLTSAVPPQIERQPGKAEATQQGMLAVAPVGGPSIISRSFPAHAPVTLKCNWTKPREVSRAIR